MTEISRRLRAAREKAGLSIEDIAATTKIRRIALQAIERGEFERLPGDFYARAFLKTYAREVHVPPDEIIREYDAARFMAQPRPQLVTAGRDRVAQAGPADAASHEAEVPPVWLSMLLNPRTGRALIAIAAVLLMMNFFRSRPAEKRTVEAGAVGTSGVVEAAAVTPATTPSPAPPQPEAPPDKLILEIRPAAPIWVAGAADGNRVLYRVLAAGEHVTVEARNDLAFRIGNAAAFTYAINGRPGKPLGAPDQVREFRITRENYRTFGR